MQAMERAMAAVDAAQRLGPEPARCDYGAGPRAAVARPWRPRSISGLPGSFVCARRARNGRERRAAAWADGSAAPPALAVQSVRVEVAAAQFHTPMVLLAVVQE